jgi:integrase
MTKPPPKLFPRGKNGLLYFRMKVNGNDKWINTRTKDIKKAKEKQLSILESQNAIKAMSVLDNDARNLAGAFVKGITGKDEVSIKLDDAFAKWTNTKPNYRRTSEERRKVHASRFASFVEWCKNENIHFVEQVSNEVALQYASHLIAEHYHPNTYNEFIAFLSNMFDTFDKVYRIPNRNPFDKRIVPRDRSSRKDIAEHKALEPDELNQVMINAGKAGQSVLDLFIIGSQTGMRLKDAALLEWNFIDGDFFYFPANKTEVYARPPITKLLRALLDRRASEREDSQYILPEIAERYQRDAAGVSKMAKKVFEETFEKEKTQAKLGPHRRVRSAIYSYHSFRSTFMSLLAMRGVSIRDAMCILGWDTPTMVRQYERMLEAARGDSDRRIKTLVNEIPQLDIDMPEVPKKFEPTPESLSAIIDKYSNVAIGQIYELSDVAIGKRIKHWGLKRSKRVASPNLAENELEKIRQELMERFYE